MSEIMIKSNMKCRNILSGMNKKSVEKVKDGNCP